LALVLLLDFLFGKGVQCGGPLKYCIVRHKDHLKCLFKSIKPEEVRELFQRPKHVRVNLLKSDVGTVIAKLKEDGYILCEHGCGSMRNNFSLDPILSDVLVFHPSVSLTDHPLYCASHLILQDKASCLPAYLLAPPPGSKVMDCCAAPGNKTTHLASIMRNEGSIKAFDKDPKRFAVLKRRLREAGVTCVTAILSDILRIRPDDYSDTEYILVDPSCSGSGMIDRLNYSCDGVSPKRLEKLATFQFKVLQHALTFPRVKRVLYSTCSIYKEVKGV
jgi:putative methyltransferase